MRAIDSLGLYAVGCISSAMTRETGASVIWWPELWLCTK